MKIVIMCGGRGKRLGAYTRRVPKPLVQLNGKTILWHKIEEYLRQGFEEFILCIGYKGEMVRRAVAKYRRLARIEFSDAGPTAGILERVWEARDLFGDRVLMTYGDTFTDMDLGDFAEWHEGHGCAATIVAAPVESPFGLVEFDGRGRATTFEEKPTLSYYIGQAIINRGALSLVEPEVVRAPDGEGIVAFYERLIELGQLGVYYHGGFEIAFNTREELRTARQRLLKFFTTTEDSFERQEGTRQRRGGVHRVASG